MKILFTIVTYLSCLVATNISAAPPNSSSRKQAEPAFSFADVKYYHRYTIKDQREYTPEKQENLETWTDMVTLHRYPDAKDGDALAKVANQVLTNYSAAKADILRTKSVPRTKDTPAEHLVVAVFREPEFAEIAFARFRMHEGVGASVIYSHRLYGKDLAGELKAWLKENGEAKEKSLMKWDAVPKPEPPTKLSDEGPAGKPQ